MYIWKYKTPDSFSNILLSSDGEYLTGLWFEGSKDALKHNSQGMEEYLPIFHETEEYLDIYFRGEEPSFIPKYKILNSTPFRDIVIDIMMSIPYGEVITYKDISLEIKKRQGLLHMSSQAVGGAVGWNPICIIIPCHRVIGSNGSLVGYGGGIDNKISLLNLEGVNIK